MSCLLAHPTGNNFVREAALGLKENGLLHELHLSIAACKGNCFEKLAALPGASEIVRRTYPESLASHLRLHPMREIVRLTAGRLGAGFLLKHEQGWASLDACYHYFDHKVAQRIQRDSQATCVYSYEDGALNTFKAAQARGLKRIYDLPIAYWRTSHKLLAEEAERLPAWSATLTGIHDSKEKRARKDEELSLADAIVVPSQFVLNSLPNEVQSAKRVFVIPFGSPPIKPVARSRNSTGKLRVLFAGSMSQRKGLGDLMAAIRLLDPDKVELHVMGSPLAPMEFYQRECPGFIYHTTRPHDQVLALMQSCDVLALPSIVEGRALVQQEALACGLPIIVTANAGAEDLVEDQQAGFLVPIRSPEALAQRLEQMANDRDLLAQMQKAAPHKARQVTWQSYRHGIAEVVQSVNPTLGNA